MLIPFAAGGPPGVVLGDVGAPTGFRMLLWPSDVLPMPTPVPLPIVLPVAVPTSVLAPEPREVVPSEPIPVPVVPTAGIDWRPVVDPAPDGPGVLVPIPPVFALPVSGPPPGPAAQPAESGDAAIAAASSRACVLFGILCPFEAHEVR